MIGEASTDVKKIFIPLKHREENEEWNDNQQSNLLGNEEICKQNRNFNFLVSIFDFFAFCFP